MFFGLDNQVVWWFGVVENRIDPLKLDRVQVRLFVHHPKEQVLNQKTGNGLKTEDLPWAYVMQPTTSASMDGIGSNHLITEGSHVVGFSRDGNTLNDLVIIGTVGGKPEDPPQDKSKKFGFVDIRTAGEIASSPRYINKELNLDPGYEGQGIPQGRYPQEKWLKESSVNRLRRGEKLDETYIKPKRELRKKGIKNVLGPWDEKPSDYGAQYPYNNVTETECGHTIELDDTKLKERYSFWHGGEAAKGTYFEFDSKGSYTLKCKLDMDFLADSMNFYSKKNIRMTADDSFGLTVDKNISLNAGQSINITAEKGLISLTAVGGLINITSTVVTNITSPVINMNTKLLKVGGTILYAG
jgi:hypothetical protein